MTDDNPKRELGGFEASTADAEFDREALPTLMGNPHSLKKSPVVLGETLN